MAPVDWTELMDVNLDDVEGDAADTMFETLAEFDPGGEEDPERLLKLFAVTQTVMLVKGTQAELAEEQLAKMAQEEGKGSAKRDQEYQKLRLEVQELKRENKDLKRFGTDTPGAGSGSQSRDMRFVREEMNEMEHQITLLQREIKEKERQLADETTTSERMVERAEEAEKELRDLKRENDQLRDDVRDYQRQLDAQRDTILSRRDDDVEVRDKISQKNKLLNAALEENRLLAENSADVEEKLADMRGKLLEAREEMERTTSEFVKMKLVVGQSDAVIEGLRRQKEMLQAQLEDHQEQARSKADADDEIMVIVNNKVEEWKANLEEKDEEVMRLQAQVMALNEKLIAANLDSEKASVAALTKALEERDQKIETLKRRLDEASGFLDANAAMMEDVRSEMSKGGKTLSEKTMKRLTNLEGTIHDKDELLKEAEDRALQAEQDAQRKDKELSEALERMRQYEAGEYGLAEAVAEIKDGKTKVNIRDRQIEELTQHINKNEMKINDMYDENESFRERLGLDPQEPIDLTEYRNKKNARQQEERALNRVLQKELETLEEERIALKQQNRVLAQAAGKRAVALGLEADDLLAVDVVVEEMKSRKAGVSAARGTAGFIQEEVEKDELRIKNIQLDQEVEKTASKMERLSSENAQFKAKNKAVMEENEQLHQGMQEINAAIKEQGTAARGDGTDIQIIQCPTLEKMLAAIEAKNLVGHYDTSLYLKAQVDNLTGHNEELRAELRETRFETTKARVELDKAQQKVTTLETEVTSLRDVGAGAHFQTMPLPEGMAITSSEVIAGLNEHVVQLLQEVSLKEDMIHKTEVSLEKFKRQFAVMRHQQGLVYQEYVEEKKQWETELESLKKELHCLQGTQEDDKVRIQEFDRLIDTLGQDDVEVRRRLADMTRKITVFRVNEKALARRYNAVGEIEANLRKECAKLKNDMIAMETAVEERLGYLQRFKDMASFKIAALQKNLDDSVASSELEKANKQFTELTEKYRDLLEKSNTLVVKSETSSGFEAEVKRLEGECAVLRTELSVEKEKLHVLEAAFENMRKQGMASSQNLTDSDVISISKKLTTLEMKELNERQRAEHASRMYDQQKTQLRQLEDRNMELETKFADLTRMNLEAQKVERELRDELANSVTKAVSDEDRKKIAQLEKTGAYLKDENAKLKDISEIATIQSRALDAQQVSRDKEVLSLRQQLLDFQAQSDEKTVIGKLHRQIVMLQVSEGTAVRRLEDANKKLIRLEAQLLRSEHRLDDKDNTIYHNRLEARSKTKFLKHTIQDMRQKFAGAVPLKQQEKFAQAMLDIQADHAAMEENLRKVNGERMDLEDKMAALEIQKRGAEELIATLKDGKGAQKVAEWHGKMEAVRLEDLRLKRQIERLKQQVQFLEGVIKRHEQEVLRLEEDQVRSAKDFESRELEWEHREVELERTIHNMERTQAEIAGAASQFEVAVGSLPDPAWPVAKQLEHAVETIKKNVKLIMDAKAEAQVFKKHGEEKDVLLKEKDKEVTARDRVITELRLRLPASAERDEAIAKATAKATSSAVVTDVGEDYESMQAVTVAQSTVNSLQARLAQKDETLHKYQELLRQAREDMSQANRHHAQEMELLQQKLHARHDAAFSKFKSAALDAVSKPSATMPSNDQLKRLNELEDIVADQDNSIAAMRQKLGHARQQIQNLKIQNDDNLRMHENEKSRLLEKHQQEVDEAVSQLRDLQAEYDAKQKELNVVQDELDGQKEANARAPTTTMKGLVERLKNQLALKEKQQQALSKALTELRADMVTQAQDEVKAHADQATAELNVQKMVDKQTKELTDQVEDLSNQLQKLRKDAKKYKDKSEACNNELEEVRADLSKKETQARKLKEDKSRLETELEQTERKVERMSTMAKQRGLSEGAQHEVEELRRKNRLLAEELKRVKHKPEKPYEQTGGKDPQAGEEAVARWEESKKWQKMVERLKGRLKDREADLDRLTKAHEMMKNVLERANRDKDSLEQKLRIATKAGGSSATEVKKESTPGTKSAAPTHELETLKNENYELLEENGRLKRDLMEAHDKVVDEVKLRNKFLQERLETLEKQLEQRQQAGQPMGVSQDEYRDLAKKEQKLQKEVIRLSEETIELKFEVESARKDIPRLKERIQDLQQYVDILKQEKDTILQSARSMSVTSLTSSGSNVRRIGESGRSIRELEKTVSLLKKVVERTQAENEKLKSATGVVSNEQVQMLQKENEGLKNQLEEVKVSMGTSLNERYTTQQKGTAKVMVEHDRLRKELLKEQEANESLRLKIRQQEVSIEQLRKDLSDSKTKLEIETAKHPPSGTGGDTKGWKSAVVTRMYEGKLKALEEDIEKKNKMLGDVKVLIREAATREQRLTHENNNLQQKLKLLEDFPPGGNTDIGRELQHARLQIDRLESEKKELLNVLQVLRQQLNKEGKMDLSIEELLAKFHSHDELLGENVEVSTQLKAAMLEKERLSREVDKLKRELSNFGPEFFEEIEDLKYNYREAVQRNVQYEEQLNQISKQFGVEVHILSDSQSAY